jgi:uncharacterized Zn finger protein
MPMVTADIDPERARRAAETLTNGGVDIARGHEDGSWIVGSFSGDETYLVRLPHRTCTCPDSRHHGGVCKHVVAVLLAEGVRA